MSKTFRVEEGSRRYTGRHRRNRIRWYRDIRQAREDVSIFFDVNNSGNWEG